MKQFVLIIFLSIIYLTWGDTNYRYRSSSAITPRPPITVGSGLHSQQQQRPGVLIGQIEQKQSTNLDDYDQRGQQQVQENEWEDINDLKPGKGNLKNIKDGRPISSNNIDVTDSSICSEVVKSTNGLIKGKLEKTSTGKNICAFYGIPYAKPPIGHLRFKRPVPIGNWEGTYEANQLPTSCVQTLYANKFLPTNYNVSEDCLYLNIWVPTSVFKNKNTKNNTHVMVWIHGGAFSLGSISDKSTDGAVLAAEQNVIVTSMQYRLGPLGFLYFGCEDAPGMVGLIDQNLALQWINTNIEQFGGNKDEITIFGESAGSISVSYHLLSPLSRNLFKRAIMMSGSANMPLSSHSKSEAIDFAYEVATSVGCWSPEDKEDSKEPIADIIRCLRNTDKILINYFKHEEKKFIDIPASLTVDDYFLPDTPQNILKTSRNSRADLIIGVTQDEGSLFLLLDYQKYLSGSNNNPTISYDTFVTILRDMFRDKPIFEQDAIISHYTNWINLDDSNENLKRLIGAAGDYSFVCPSIEFAKQWSSKGHRVYFYWFTQKIESDLLPFPKWTGVIHGADIIYIFGGPMIPSGVQNENNFSHRIQQLFTNFAKTGVPSKNWGTYTSAYPVYLDLNATLISDVTPTNIYGPRADDCVFWNNDLPILREFHSNSIKCKKDEPILSTLSKLSSCSNNVQKPSVHFIKTNKCVQ